jgi:hypothetical protein
VVGVKWSEYLGDTCELDLRGSGEGRTGYSGRITPGEIWSCDGSLRYSACAVHILRCSSNKNP